jgi:hypothetical protein
MHPVLFAIAIGIKLSFHPKVVLLPGTGIFKGGHYLGFAFVENRFCLRM